MLGERPNDALYPAQKALYRFVLEQHVTGKQFRKDTPERPNVNLIVISTAQNNLWSAVTAGLYIGAEVVMNETRTAEVDYFNYALGIAFD